MGERTVGLKSFVDVDTVKIGQGPNRTMGLLSAQTFARLPVMSKHKSYSGTVPSELHLRNETTKLCANSSLVPIGSCCFAISCSGGDKLLEISSPVVIVDLLTSPLCD